MNTFSRACVVGAVSLALGAVAPLGSAHAATEVDNTAGLLAKPTGLSPDDSNLVYPHAARRSVTLDWNPVSGANGYRVQVGRDSTWSDSDSVILTKDVLVSEYTLPLLLPHASYVWRVAALRGSQPGHWSSEGDANGNPSGQSEAEFTRAWHDDPADENDAAPVLNSVATPFVGVPTLSWKPVEGASAYWVQVATEPFPVAAESGLGADTSPPPATEFQPAGLIASCTTPRTRVTPYEDLIGVSGSAGACKWNLPTDGTPVFWRVRALDRAVESFAGGPVAPASKAGISLDTDGGTLADPCAGSGLPCGDDGSEWGPWSDSSFTWSLAPAVPADPLNPVSTSVVATGSLQSDPDALCQKRTDGALPEEAEHARCTDAPTISWSAFPGATKYRVTIALDDALTNIQHVVWTPGTRITLAKSWPEATPLTSYYYVVQACDADRCGTVTDRPPSFSKVTPRVVALTSPGATGEMRFTWKSHADVLAAASGFPATQDAWKYHVQVSTSTAFSTVVDEKEVDELFYVPQVAYPDGSYFWRVQAVDIAGNKLPWSLSKSFVRDTTPPVAVSVSPSSSVAPLQPLTVTFSEPVSGVSASTLTLSPAAPATVTVLSPSQARITPSKVLMPGATYTVKLSSAIVDGVGNTAVATGPAVTVNPKVDDKSKALAYAGTWSQRTSSNAMGGTYRSSLPTPTKKTSATVRVSGVGVTLYGCLGPANGYVDLLVDGKRKARVSTYRSYSGCGIKIASVSGLTRTAHTVKVVGIGARVAASKGNAVALDALTVTP